MPLTGALPGVALRGAAAQPRLCLEPIPPEEYIIKRILVLLDSNPVVGAFDAVMALDGGVDYVLPLGGVTSSEARRVAYEVVFSRNPNELADLAIFIGGSDVAEGEATLQEIRQAFFDSTRVSVMLDSNGCNTTAAATVARIRSVIDVPGRQAVVLAGTGPVGLRIATLLAQERANVTICSRDLSKAQSASRVASDRAGRAVHSARHSFAETATLLQGTEILVAAGAPGVRLLREDVWQASQTLQVLADLNAVPPSGIEGLETASNGQRRGAIRLFGALGIGALKKQTHFACLRRLFERNDFILDLEQIYAIATELQSRCAF